MTLIITMKTLYLGYVKLIFVLQLEKLYICRIMRFLLFHRLNNLDDHGSISGGGNDGIFFFATASGPALGSTQPPIQWVLGVKQPKHEADHSPPSSTELKNMWGYTSTPPICFHGVVLH
jgi:hypothetical protein